ncbi:hypothetical protein N7452_006357 [Penicillium brevicompactum]|uniref:PKD domain-containing protein n=1 Tax=Penicillium brevicompactum TaxID=5074 RepID=A0A9W9QNC7_PENBR|nr:hypothetical protein N7452_006357 [Penicillium brevicompactum]
MELSKLLSPRQNPWSLGHITFLFIAFTGTLVSSHSTSPDCQSLGTNGPWQITPDCVDPVYQNPIYTSQADESSPVQHRRIHGYFNGTEIDFNVYLPHQGWDGRFFQLVFPTQNSTATPEAIGFGADSGGYTVHVAGTGGYRADAAVAKISKRIARDYYKDPSRRIYGYIYGGSGGSFKTVGAMENTFSVWDGSVPLIQGIPISDPHGFSVTALGGLVLDDKAQQLQDAVRPGASNDSYHSFSNLQLSVLEEVTAMGMPPAAWEDFDGSGRNRSQLYEVLRAAAVAMKSIDPTYVEDFWNKSGYLGTEISELGDVIRASLIDLNATVRQISSDADNVPVELDIDASPLKALRRNWYDFTLHSPCNGVGKESTFTGRMDPNSTTVSLYSDNNSTVLQCLKPGSKLRFDNRWFLSLHAFHRYELPTRPGYDVFDYLRNADGTPKYPQRSVLTASILAESATGGGTHTGNITAKMIVMDNLMDNKAFPWEADWYRKQVRNSLGDRFGDNYRLYYSDNADHEMGPVQGPVQYRLIDFTGLYEQHLRDLSAWVERGVEPPTATNYTVCGGQVHVPESSSQRAGIQPVAYMKAEGSTRAEVQAGSPVALTAVVEVPNGVGKIVSIEWDIYGNGSFVSAALEEPSPVVKVNATHIYSEPGEYFPSVRVASHRSGDKETTYALAYNLGRARVVVK